MRLPDKAGHCGGGQKGRGCCRNRCVMLPQQRHEEGTGQPGEIPGTERMRGVKATVIPVLIGPLEAVTPSSWASDPSRSQGHYLRSLSRRVDKVAHSDLNGLTKEGRCFVVRGGARTASEHRRGTLVAGTGSSSLPVTPETVGAFKRPSWWHLVHFTGSSTIGIDSCCVFILDTDDTAAIFRLSQQSRD